MLFPKYAVLFSQHFHASVGTVAAARSQSTVGNFTILWWRFRSLFKKGVVGKLKQTPDRSKLDLPQEKALLLKQPASIWTDELLPHLHPFYTLALESTAGCVLSFQSWLNPVQCYLPAVRVPLTNVYEHVCSHLRADWTHFRAISLLCRIKQVPLLNVL